MAYSVEDRVNAIFWSKYTRSHLSPPGNLSHVENLIREDVIELAESLEQERDAWKDAHDRIEAAAKILAEALEDAMQQEGVFYGDPEVIRNIMLSLGVGTYK